MTALHHAITLAGSEAELVRRMQQLDPTSKIDRAHLYYWRTRAAKGVPADHCRLIERAVDGRVTVHDLRPDVFGPSMQVSASRRNHDVAAFLDLSARPLSSPTNASCPIG